MQFHLLNEILVIFSFSMAILIACSRFSIPPIIGYLAAGAIIGPYGLELIASVHEVELLAEIGVILLLFTIGIEFSFKKLLQIRKALIAGGMSQVLMTMAAAYLGASTFGLSTQQSIFAGFLISLSSTAIVLKTLQEKAEIDTVYGQTALAILIFQDLAIVPMMLLTPLLGTGQGAAQAVGGSALAAGIKSAVAMALIVAATKYLVPAILHRVAKTRDRDLFLLCVIVICIAVAVATSSAGLSLALGAFIAGLVISESEYSHQALGYVLPFKSIFTGFFFVSIGMLLDTGFIAAKPFMVTAVTAGMIAMKALTASISGLLLGISFPNAVMAGLSISQIGEFSFVLSKTGMSFGIIGAKHYQAFLAAAIITMALTPLLMTAGKALSGRLKKYDRSDAGGGAESKPDEKLSGHVIIVGYGVNGRNLSKAARAANIPYAIVDLNPETVRHESAAGEPIHYGDATYPNVLEHLCVHEARIMVVAIPDRMAVRAITRLAREMNPGLHIITRTRFQSEVEEIRKLGADEVIPEEFETSIEIFTRVLKRYLVPESAIISAVDRIRADNYEMLRAVDGAARIGDFAREAVDIKIGAIRLEECFAACGKSLDELEVRKRYGVSVIAIVRGRNKIVNPGGSEKLNAGDTLVALGDSRMLAEALKNGCAGADQA